MFSLCLSSPLMTPERLECRTLSMTTPCCPAYQQDNCVFSQMVAAPHQVCVPLCSVRILHLCSKTCESLWHIVALKCVCFSAGSLMCSAPQLESERVVCIVDLCLLGERRVEMICSKLYRTADICQPDGTQWDATRHEDNHAKKKVLCNQIMDISVFRSEFSCFRGLENWFYL